MRLLYNALLIGVSPLLLLLVSVILLLRPEKRHTLPSRFGRGLVAPPRRPAGVIWVHALSVGEVTSAIPLVAALRNEFPEHTLLFSATTATGQDLARERVRPYVDALVAFPVDIVPVVRRFIKRLRPNLFILVETDFWPNLLFELSAAGIPTLLVNGRVSARSMRSYRRFAPLFRPLFNQFRLLCMQTAADTAAMEQLGIAREKLTALGNLKFAPVPEPVARYRTVDLGSRPAGHALLLCGSTHPGEEDLILSSFRAIHAADGAIHLAIAPRRIERCEELITLANEFGFTATKLTAASRSPATVTIIDTIGDLPALYRLADIALIGGSLVDQGGHNPLEAARHGCPILFGPYMEDFAEISDELLRCRAAITVTDETSLATTVKALLNSPEHRRRMGDQAIACLQRRSKVIEAHLAAIKALL